MQLSPVASAPARTTSADLLERFEPQLRGTGAWRFDTSDPDVLRMRFLDNSVASFSDTLLRNEIEGVEVLFESRSGKPLPTGESSWADEDRAIPEALLKPEFGVVAVQVARGDRSIPAVVYARDARAAADLLTVFDMDRLLEGRRRMEVRTLPT